MFAGVSIDGSVIAIDTKSNNKLYGKNAPAAEIIAGHITTDAEAARRFERAILAGTSAVQPAPAAHSAATTAPDTAVSTTAEATPSAATTFPMEDAAPGTEPPK